MFTIEQIKAAHAKVRSGADFPQYIRNIRQLGVAWYTTYVADGHTDFIAQDGSATVSEPKYGPLAIAAGSNAVQFSADLKSHQQGGSTYPEFCEQCAASGVERWVVDLSAMTCTYYDRAGRVLLEEEIPA